MVGLVRVVYIKHTVDVVVKAALANDDLRRDVQVSLAEKNRGNLMAHTRLTFNIHMPSAF